MTVTFAYPRLLWLWLLVFGVVLWSLRGRRLRSRDWKLLAQRGRPPHLRSLSLLVAASLLVLALARPKFGSIIEPPLAPGHDVVLLMDVSRSMAAEDAVPSRMAVAIEAAESLVAALATDAANRAGVVAFAGRGVRRCPLTENLGSVVEVLRGLKPGTVQPGGTDLGAGLVAALETFGDEEHAAGRSIVVFSDGEDLAERWRTRLDRLARSGTIVHAVAIGDPENGHPVPSGQGNEPLVYEGAQVLSRRVDTALEAIAEENDGAVLKLGLATADLKTLYQTRIAPVARQKRAARHIAERPERFPFFLAVALGLALSGCWPAGRIGPWRWAWNRIAGAVLLGTLAFTSIGAGQEPEPEPEHPTLQKVDTRETAAIPRRASAAELVRQGDAAYAGGSPAEALRLFEAAVERAPDQPIPRYNAAAVLFQMGR